MLVEHFCHIDAAGLPLDVLLERAAIVRSMQATERTGDNWLEMVAQGRARLDAEMAIENVADELLRPI